MCYHILMKINIENIPISKTFNIADLSLYHPFDKTLYPKDELGDKFFFWAIIKN